MGGPLTLSGNRGWVQMGAKSATLAGVSGVGDIMLTCFVDKSRNRSVITAARLHGALGLLHGVPGHLFT